MIWEWMLETINSQYSNKRKRQKDKIEKWNQKGQTVVLAMLILLI
jgi:hypothetical protein